MQYWYSNTFGLIFSLFIDYSMLTCATFANLFRNLVLNPIRDLDLAVTTDFEDLLAFLNDNIEFAEQDKSFLIDALFDFYATSSVESISLFVLDVFFLKLFFKKISAVALTKNFWL